MCSSLPARTLKCSRTLILIIEFCKQEILKSGSGGCHSVPWGQDDFTLLNALASVNKDKEFLEEICGCVDFQIILEDHTSLSGVDLSLNKIIEGCKNISELLLGGKS